MAASAERRFAEECLVAAAIWFFLVFHEVHHLWSRGYGRLRRVYGLSGECQQVEVLGSSKNRSLVRSIVWLSDGNSRVRE